MNTNYLVSTLAGTGTSSSSSPSSSPSSELSKHTAPAPRNPHKIDSFLNNGQQQQSAKMIPTAQMQNQFMPGGAQTQPQVNSQASSMLPPHPMAGVYAPAQMQPGAYQPYPYPYYANQQMGQGGFYGGAYGMPPPPPPPPHLVQTQNGQPYGQMPFGHNESNAASAPISHNINDLLKPSPAKSPNGATSSPPNAKTNGPGTPKAKKQKADVSFYFFSIRGMEFGEIRKYNSTCLKFGPTFSQNFYALELNSRRFSKIREKKKIVSRIYLDLISV